MHSPYSQSLSFGAKSLVKCVCYRPSAEQQMCLSTGVCSGLLSYCGAQPPWHRNKQGNKQYSTVIKWECLCGTELLLQAVLFLSGPYALTVAILYRQSEAQETECIFYRSDFKSSLQCRTGPLGLSRVAFFTASVLNGLQYRAIQVLCPQMNCVLQAQGHQKR